MTLRTYSDRKKWPLDAVEVRLTHRKVEDSEADEGRRDIIRRILSVEGDLTGEQRARLVEIANKCPVRKPRAA